MDTEVDVETRGRCTMRTVGNTTTRNSPRIEADETEPQSVSRRAVALRKVRDRVTTFATRITYGR